MDPKNNQFKKAGGNNFGLPKTKFEPLGPTPQNNKGIKLAAIIGGILLLIGGGIGFYYWFIHTSQATHENLTDNHLKIDNEKNAAGIFDDDFLTSDSTDVKLKQVPDHKEEKIDTNDTKPKTGTITKINAPQGVYYVIKNSFIDEDLAASYAKKLKKQGLGVTIIAPNPSAKYPFHKVAIGQGSTLVDTQALVEELKPKYGAAIWVFKY